MYLNNSFRILCSIVACFLTVNLTAQSVILEPAPNKKLILHKNPPIEKAVIQVKTVIDADYTSVNPGDRVEFTSSGSEFTTISWNFDDGYSSNLTDPSHVFETPGIYEVTAITRLGEFSDTTSILINVGDIVLEDLTQEILEDFPLPQPITSPATAKIDADFTEIDPGDEVEFISIGSAFTTISWNFDDGNTSEQSHPRNTFKDAGIYEVTAIAKIGESSDTASILITVGEIVLEETSNEILDKTLYIQTPQPEAYTLIDASFTEINPGEEVEFTSAGSEFTTISWNFDDGNTSNLADPINVFENPGIYEVTAITKIGESNDTASILINVGGIQLEEDNQEVFDEVLIYPNPTDYFCEIDIETNKAIGVEIQIIDQFGRRLFSKNLFRSTSFNSILPVQELPSGTYMVVLNNADDQSEQIVKKLIIQKE